jgi:hypothetical protein
VNSQSFVSAMKYENISRKCHEKCVWFFLFLIDIVLAYGEACRKCSSNPKNFRATSSCGGKYLEDLVYLIPIDIIEVLRERVENAAKVVQQFAIKNNA